MIKNDKETEDRKSYMYPPTHMINAARWWGWRRNIELSPVADPGFWIRGADRALQVTIVPLGYTSFGNASRYDVSIYSIILYRGEVFNSIILQWT